MRRLELNDGPEEDRGGKREVEFVWGRVQRKTTGSEDGEIQMDAGHLIFRSCTELLIRWPDY